MSHKGIWTLLYGCLESEMSLMQGNDKSYLPFFFFCGAKRKKFVSVRPTPGRQQTSASRLFLKQ